MKRRDIITISDSGQVQIPATVAMRDFEIAQLFGVLIPTIKGRLKSLLKVRHFRDCSGGVVSGNRIIPECFGLDMIVTIAFQVDSHKADIFRRHILKQATNPTLQTIFMGVDRGYIH